MMVSFVLSFFSRGVLDEILNLIESVSEGFPSYSYIGMLSFAMGLNELYCADTEGWLWLLHYTESRLLDRAVVLSNQITSSLLCIRQYLL